MLVLDFFFGQTIFILLNAAKIDACVVWGFFLAIGKGPQILMGEKNLVWICNCKTNIKCWSKGYYFNVLLYKGKYSYVCDNLV